ncbi:hypothetical protein DM01DRAFT_1339044 [Hesseltinella vesiculosa]|uniref:Uncharacterized protein n=1 Tax=Hesseltinella vesiculosa TaxID=101127 RepID=A0A1X2G7Y0_9FUNG|nr:hypothetical protein DM01DRAFT_1339044 [Hesseltinella vesiculosa]
MMSQVDSSQLSLLTHRGSAASTARRSVVGQETLSSLHKRHSTLLQQVQATQAQLLQQQQHRDHFDIWAKRLDLANGRMQRKMGHLHPNNSPTASAKDIVKLQRQSERLAAQLACLQETRTELTVRVQQARKQLARSQELTCFYEQQIRCLASTLPPSLLPPCPAPRPSCSLLTPPPTPSSKSQPLCDEVLDKYIASPPRLPVALPAHAPPDLLMYQQCLDLLLLAKQRMDQYLLGLYLHWSPVLADPDHPDRPLLPFSIPMDHLTKRVRQHLDQDQRLLTELQLTHAKQVTLPTLDLH